LTKMFERVERDTLSALAARLAKAPLRGEYVVVIAGASGVPSQDYRELRQRVDNVTDLCGCPIESADPTSTESQRPT